MLNVMGTVLYVGFIKSIVLLITLMLLVANLPVQNDANKLNV